MIQAIANDRTAEWHVARTKGVGASEAAAVCGLSQYETAFDVWARKTGRVANKESTPVMELGTYCEPDIMDRVHTEHPIKVRAPGLFAHPEHRVVLASPDGVLEDGRGLEMKVTTENNHEITEAEDGLPASWLCQAQQQIAVCGFPAVLFGVVVLPSGVREWLLDNVGAAGAARVIAEGLRNKTLEVRYWTIEKHSKFINGLINHDIEFWRHVETDTPPDIDWEHSRSCEGVKAAFREATKGKEVDLDSDLQSMWTERTAKKEFIKSAEAEVKRIDAELFLRMQDAEIGVFPTGRKIRKVQVSETQIAAFTRKASAYLREMKK